MPILYFADSVHKRYKPAADQLQRLSAQPLTASGKNNLNGAMATRLWHPAPAWQVDEVLLKLSSTSNKDYSISKLSGRGIITGLNDRLWLLLNNSPVSVAVPQGFYTGTELCAALKAAAEATKTFISAGATLTVTYDTNSRFKLQPSAGTIGLLYRNSMTQGSFTAGSTCYSTAAVVFGFTQDAVSAASITGDAVAPSLGTKFEIVGSAGSAATAIALTEQLTMDVDQALEIDVSALAGATAEWKATYKEV